MTTSAVAETKQEVKQRTSTCDTAAIWYSEKDFPKGLDDYAKKFNGTVVALSGKPGGGLTTSICGRINKKSYKPWEMVDQAGELSSDMRAVKSIIEDSDTTSGAHETI